MEMGPPRTGFLPAEIAKVVRPHKFKEMITRLSSDLSRMDYQASFQGQREDTVPLEDIFYLQIYHETSDASISSIVILERLHSGSLPSLPFSKESFLDNRNEVINIIWNFTKQIYRLKGKLFLATVSHIYMSEI